MLHKGDCIHIVYIDLHIYFNSFLLAEDDKVLIVTEQYTVGP